MPIVRFLEGSSFDPESLQVIVTAYEEARQALGLVDRSDPFTETVARKIIEVAETGERDPTVIRQRAIDNLGAIIVPRT